MIITLIILGVMIVAIIAYIAGAINNTEPLPRCCFECMTEHRHCFGMFSPHCCDHYGIGSMRDKIRSLELDKDILNRQLNILLEDRARTSRTVYASSLKERELVDIITKGSEKAKELAKSLDIPIN